MTTSDGSNLVVGSTATSSTSLSRFNTRGWSLESMEWFLLAVNLVGKTSSF